MDASIIIESTLTDPTERINELHAEISAALRRTVPAAIEIGRLLTEQKASMEHGQFLLWLADHVNFKARTAQEYMGFYEYRDKCAQCADFTEARAATREPRAPKPAEPISIRITKLIESSTQGMREAAKSIRDCCMSGPPLNLKRHIVMGDLQDAGNDLYRAVSGLLEVSAEAPEEQDTVLALSAPTPKPILPRPIGNFDEEESQDYLEKIQEAIARVWKECDFFGRLKQALHPDDYDFATVECIGDDFGTPWRDELRTFQKQFEDRAKERKAQARAAKKQSPAPEAPKIANPRYKVDVETVIAQARQLETNRKTDGTRYEKIRESHTIPNVGIAHIYQVSAKQWVAAIHFFGDMAVTQLGVFKTRKAAKEATWTVTEAA
jgi:hypothetical protein